MHPDSKEWFEEGASFVSEFLVRDGVFHEDKVVKIFMEAGKYPNCSGKLPLLPSLSVWDSKEVHCQPRDASKTTSRIYKPRPPLVLLAPNRSKIFFKSMVKKWFNSTCAPSEM